MKNIFSILVTAIFSLLIVSCSSGDSETRNAARESLPSRDVVADPVTPAPAIVTQGVAGVKHYICPNNCEGSGADSGGTCPVCGTAYVHNQAYHNTPGANPNTPTQVQTQTANPSPAQNAAGVWHYVCSAGCGGGAGAAGNCPDCGAALSHNQAYHN